MIEIALIVLKFAALVVGGVFAAIGLLTDYRHEDGRVSKWGRIALFGIILSTIIAAGTQAVESYRDRTTALANDAANRKSEEQTQNILSQIRRAIYPFRDFAFDVNIVYPDSPTISGDLKGLDLGEPIWQSADKSDAIYSLSSKSPNYSEMGIVRELIESRMELKLWRKDADPSRDDPDLTCGLENHSNKALLEGQNVTVSVEYAPTRDRLVVSQRIASLEDIRDAHIQLKLYFLGPGIKRPRLAWKTVLKETQVEATLHVANHALSIALEPNDDSQAFEGKISADK